MKKLFAYLCLVMVLLTMSAPRLTYVAEANKETTPKQGIEARPIGQPDSSASVSFQLALRVDEAAVETFIDQVYNPKSPLFRKFLSPEQFVESFTSSSRDYAVSTLEAQGFSVTRQPGSTLIDVSGPVYLVEQYFQASLQSFAVNSRATRIASLNEPVMPEELRATFAAVVGLSSSDSFVGFEQTDAQSRKIAPAAAPDGLSPAKIATAYNFPSSLNALAGSTKYSGKDRRIGVATAYSFSTSDIELFLKEYKITRTAPIRVVPIGGSTAEKDLQTAYEVEQVAAQVPDAEVIVYAAADPTFDNFTRLFNQVNVDNLVDSVSLGYGLCEAQIPVQVKQIHHQLLMQAVSQGISYFVAAGDGGAYDCGGRTQSVRFPSSDPFVTSVGGTTLFTGSNGLRTNEVAWSQTGGGFSSEFRRLSFQKGPGLPKGDKARKIPDVALASDLFPGFPVVYQGQWRLVGGTSIAAPNLSALWVLTAEAFGRRVGFAAPTFYQINRSSQYPGVFFDVITGQNDYYGPGFSAGRNWDPVTGVGAPDGAALVRWVQVYGR